MLTAQCDYMYVFGMNLTNIYCVSTQHYSFGLCGGDAVYFMRDMKSFLLLDLTRLHTLQLYSFTHFIL